ncbi:hypothetical protein PUG81_24455 [Erwiniaceae bacterium L1_54_6]|jgi:hypothetical protein|nr:hypothetical protein [Erwiniaceae bacterium L1_54_6]
MKTEPRFNSASALTSVTRADITREMRESCFIRLDNSDEAFFFTATGWMAQRPPAANLLYL